MMNRRTIIPISLVALAFFSQPVAAEFSFRGVAHIGYEFGGDTILKAHYTDGSTSSINAGDGLIISGGARYIVNDNFSVQGTLGWKYQGLQDATNGDARLVRYPVDALALFGVEQHRFGVGVTYHIDPTLYAGGVLSPFETNFENALGNIYQYDYEMHRGLSVGARYTALTYTIKNTNTDFDASSFSIHLTAAF